MAWPMALRAVMMFSLVIIDLYLVSSLGEEAVASIGIASVISGMVMGTTFAFSNAMQIKVAQAFGSGDPLELKTAFYCGLIINVSLVALGIVLILFGGVKLLNMMAHTQSVAVDASAYLHVFLWVLMAEALSGAFTSYFNGLGKTKMAFFSFLISAPVNIASSIVLIFGLHGFPELGLVGAAWGTFFGALLRFLFLLLMYCRLQRDSLNHQGWLHARLKLATIKQFQFSWPIAATFISMTFANQACMAIYSNLNVFQFAAITLIMPWIRIAGQLSYTWTQATGILIAQMLGKSLSREDLDEFLSRAWRGAFMAAAVVFYQFF